MQNVGHTNIQAIVNNFVRVKVLDNFKDLVLGILCLLTPEGWLSTPKSQLLFKLKKYMYFIKKC